MQKANNILPYKEFKKKITRKGRKVGDKNEQTQSVLINSCLISLCPSILYFWARGPQKFCLKMILGYISNYIGVLHTTRRKPERYNSIQKINQKLLMDRFIAFKIPALSIKMAKN